MIAKQKKLTVEETNINHVLITDVRHEYLMKIFKGKCIGEVSLYTDEDNNNIVDGEFIKNDNMHKNYSWKWAHKVFYSYERLTSMVGKNELNGYFENRGNERIYIFENLSSDDIYSIKCITKEHCVMFNIKEEDKNMMDDFANITHNFYEAWLRVNYLDFNHDAYLKVAKEQLGYLKYHIFKIKEDEGLMRKIDYYIENTELFKNDNEIRLELLKIFNENVKVADYSAA